MKKRISTRAICLLVAAIMLVGALTVSAINGSPYENLKSAVINALFNENFTLEGEFTIKVDGHVQEREWVRSYFSTESRLEIGGGESFRLPGDAEPTRSHERISYETRYFRINPVFTGGYDTQWYSVSRPWRNHDAGFPSSLGHEMFGTAGRNSNYLRLAELVVDLFVGDLKNNLTMSSRDGVTSISGAITESQLPEFARIVIDIAIDEQLRWRNIDTLRREDFDGRPVLDIPMRSVTIDRIQGNADIDGDGNLTYVNVLGIATFETIFGDTYVVEIGGVMRFTDIGTTVPGNTFAGAREMFDEHFSTPWQHRQLFFTLDENGNIDIDSITDQWPQWTRHDSRIVLSETSWGS